jgi:hypothetical protein
LSAPSNICTLSDASSTASENWTISTSVSVSWSELSLSSTALKPVTGPSPTRIASTV